MIRRKMRVLANHLHALPTTELLQLPPSDGDILQLRRSIIVSRQGISGSLSEPFLQIPVSGRLNAVGADAVTSYRRTGRLAP